MTDLAPEDVRTAIASDDPEVVLDRLNAVVLQLRRGVCRLPVETAKELLRSLPLITHPLGQVAVWHILVFSPPFPELLTDGINWLKNPNNHARAQAVGALLSVFPNEKDSLIALCQEETDQFMRYEIARSFAATQPREAWKRLCELVESAPILSMELTELIPGDLAGLATEADLPFLEKKARTVRKTVVWTHTLGILHQRASGP